MFTHKILSLTLVLVSLVMLTCTTEAADNSWTNTGNGYWDVGVGNWSASMPPSNNFSTIWITNANTKTVTIDSLTASFPGVMTISNLTMQGVGAGINTLWIKTGGSPTPFRILNNFTLGTNAALLVTNSTLLVDGTSFTVDGAATLRAGSWLVATNADVYIGYNSTATFTLNSSVVSNKTGYLGYNSSANNNVATVTGSGAVWNNSSDLTVGNYGFGNTLTITNGGTVFNTVGYIGYEASASNNAVTVIGPGAVWTNSSALFVGYYGSGNTLTIAGSGTVYNATGYIGVDPGAKNNTVTVTGAGSVWSNRNDLTVGNFGSGNTLSIADSGTVFNATGYIGYGQTATNNTVTVTGPGSAWKNSASLTVGFNGSGNTLSIANSGTVYNADGYIGSEIGANNNAVTVTGSGSVWSNRNDLYIGFAAVGNQLTISSSGAVVANNLTLGPNASGAGTLTLAGGTLSVGSLTVTNTASRVAFRYGLLNSGGTFVTNGQLFVVGNGSITATYHLTGGVHSFADGLRVRIAAIVTGCGTITGNVLVDAGGQVLADCGGTLTFTGILTNNGILRAINGTTLESYGPVVNNGSIDVVNGNTNFHSTFINNGTVLANVPPLINCSSNKTVQCGTAWSFDTPTGYDYCNGSDLTFTIVSTVTNGSCPQAVITRSWQTTDSCDHSATCTQTVTVSGFTPGNIVVYRVGDGSSPLLTNTGKVVFLDEYTTNGILVQSMLMPTNYFGANSPLIGDGWGVSEGAITRSTDGRYIVLTGYGATIGQVTNFSLPQVYSTTVPRVVGLVDGFGHIDTTTTQTDQWSNVETFRSAASTDGTNLWMAGDNGGIRYATRGASYATRVGDWITNIRQVGIFSNQLFFSTNARDRSIYAVTPPLPTTGGSYYQAFSNLQSSVSSRYGFVLLSLPGGPSGLNTLYIADDNSPGAIYKWSLQASGAWNSNGVLTAANARFLTGKADLAGKVQLYIAGSPQTGGGNLYGYTDTTGWNAAPTGNGGNITAVTNMGVTVASNTAVHGIAFVPLGGELFPVGPGRISVGPITDFYTTGLTGGPFPGTKTYSVANPGTSPVNWSATVNPDWITLSPASGVLTSGGNAYVTASFNTNALVLNDGTHTATITFTNTSSGLGNTTRPVKLVLKGQTVTPASAFSSSGPSTGPFAPLTKVYTLSNSVASGTITWTAGKSAVWLNLSATSGTLAGGAATNITVSINTNNAKALSVGSYSDVVLFSNVTATALIAERPVSLTIGNDYFFEDFSTYVPTYLVGQRGWTRALSPLTLPLRVSGGQVTIPAGQTVDNEDGYKNFPFTSNQVVYVGMTLTVSNAPSVVPSYFAALYMSTNAGGYANYRLAASNTTASTFAFSARVTGEPGSPFIAGPGGLSYGARYSVILATEVAGSNMTVYVNPTSENRGEVTPYLTRNIGVGTPPLTVGSFVISQYGMPVLPNVGVSFGKVAVSTNYVDVYNFLPPVASFTGAPTNGLQPLAVTFTDTSTGSISNRFWDFGDSTTTNVTTNVLTHVYSAGTYSVMLIAMGSGGVSTNFQSNYIRSLTPFESWQYRYFGSPGNPSAGPNADPDGDGVSNTNEFLAGFNPTNSAAFPHIISVVATGNDVKVTYLGANGDSQWSPGITTRTNVLDVAVGSAGGNYSDNFVSTGQTNILSGGTGSGFVTNMVETSGATNTPARYYRVRVLLP